MERMKEIKNPQIVTRVSVIDTIRAIEPGKTAVFDCRQLASYGSAKAAVSRLNAEEGRETYRIASDNNGASYSVTHL